MANLLRAVQLNSVETGRIAIFSRMHKPINHVFEVFFFHSPGLFKVMAEEVELELDITCANRLIFTVSEYLSSRVRYLRNCEAAMCLRYFCELAEGRIALTREGRIRGDNEVSRGLELVGVDHDVACRNCTVTAFTPAPVDIDKFLRGNATLRQVCWMPCC